MENSSEFPDEVIDLVVKRLVCIEDFVRSSGVCKSWESCVEIWKKHNLRFAPCLMLATYDEKHRQEPTQSFYSISNKRVFSRRLPETHGRKCWGSPFGWLVTIGLDLNIHLFNPFSNIQLSLPSQPTFPNQYPDTNTPKYLRHKFVRKFVLSSNPSDPSCVVMAICGEFSKLAFTKPGNEAWTSVSDTHTCGYKDVTFFNGLVYAVTTEGNLRVCDINTPHPKITDIATATPPEDLDDSDKFYLVEISGDLHFVERILISLEAASVRDFKTYTEAFQVYKFDFHTESWTELEDIGDHALFVGRHSSFSISTFDYPEFKRSCIYFTDDHYELRWNNFCDMGVFDMEQDEVELINLGNDVISKVSRPLFFMPGMC